MQIRCPNCNYSKQIDPALLPAGTTRATCPKCEDSFELPHAGPSVAEEPQTGIDSSSQPVISARQAEIEALPKAGFWLRVVASIIDAAIVLALQLVLGLMLTLAGVVSIGNSEGQLIALVTLVQLLGFAISCAYYVIFTANGGQTPGKMALRIKAVRCDGSPISYGRATLREVLYKTISLLILCIGFLMVAFDKQKQGLHDRMADTYVIKL